MIGKSYYELVKHIREFASVSVVQNFRQCRSNVSVSRYTELLMCVHNTEEYYEHT